MGVPHALHLSLEVAVGRGAELGEQALEHDCPGTGQAGGPGTHQGERADPAGLPEHDLPCHQATERVAKQVYSVRLACPARCCAGRRGTELVGDHRHVRCQCGDVVGARVVGAGGLVLAPHVDGDHLAAGCRQQLEHREEVFFAPGVAGDEQGGLPLTHARSGQRFERGEAPPGSPERQAPYPGGQREGSWCTHRRPAYPASLEASLLQPWGMLCAGLWTVQTWPVTGPFRPPRDRRLRPVAGWLRSWAGCSWAGSACSLRADRPPLVRLRTRGFLGAASLTVLFRPELSRPEPSLAPGRRVTGDLLRPVSPRSSSSSASRPCRPPCWARGRFPVTPSGMSSSLRKCSDVE